MKCYIQHEDFIFELLSLMGKIQHDHPDFDFVLGIKNGGLHLSERIAKHFHKPHRSVLISFYDTDDKRLDSPRVDDFTLIEELKAKKHGTFLLVDDIIDSGSTLRWFIKHTGLERDKDFKVATMHWCSENSPDLKPHWYVANKHKTDWIVYPWEV